MQVQTRTKEEGGGGGQMCKTNYDALYITIFFEKYILVLFLIVKMIMLVFQK